jgi:acetyl esterase/lipase
LWDLASPVAQCRSGAPPFFVLHGSADSLAKVEEARLFVAALRAQGGAPVAYGELPGAQHAWDFFHSVRCLASVRAIALFLEWQRARVHQ